MYAGSVVSSIILTLAYSGQFYQGLTSEQLYLRLISKKYIPFAEFSYALIQLVRRKLVYFHSGKYQLHAVPIVEYPGFYSRKKEIDLFVRVAGFIPWIQAIAITGSVAAGTIRRNDDIDFLIITKSNSLWLVRPLIVLFGLLSGRRRSWYKEEPRSWCFNFWLEETELSFQKNRRTIYTAFELFQAKFVFDRTQNIEKTMWIQNEWIRSLLPHMYLSKMKSFENKSKLVVTQATRTSKDFKHSNIRSFTTVLSTIATNVTNTFAYKIQQWYMKSHQTTEQVEKHMAFFHPRDTKKMLYAGWKAVLKKNATYRPFLSFSVLQSLQSAIEWSERVRKSGKQIVLVTGVFDVLHTEHVAFLNQAALQSDVLLVALESDARVRTLKGADRPLFNQDIRARMLARLRIAQCITILPDDFSAPEQHAWFIRSIKPSVLAVSEHSLHQDKKRAILQENGGEVRIVYSYNSEISTTKILSVG